MKAAAILIMLTVLACSAKKEPSALEIKDESRTINNLSSRDSLVSIIKFDSAYQYIFPTAISGAPLSHDEIEICDSLLRDQVKKYNLAVLKRYKELVKEYPDQKFDLSDFEIALHPYGIQYLAVILQNNNKLVFVNYICDPTQFDDWEKTIIEVDDGGTCYFNLKINLTTKRVFDFLVNGEA